MPRYHVDAFVPPAPGCGGTDAGWTPNRCQQFATFLNNYAAQGWRLHSSEYRQVKGSNGCGPTTGTWLVCIFEAS
jgi:hypothetical protein